MNTIRFSQLFGVCLLTLSLFSTRAWAQQEEFENFDPNQFSQYSDAKNTQKYCTQKVNYLSPAKLISVGYEFVMPHTLTSTPVAGAPTYLDGVAASKNEIQSVAGMQLAANFPVISKSSLIINLGFSYANSRFMIKNPEGEFARRLEANGLRTGGVNLTVFKPLNQRNFLIFQGNTDMNGSYNPLSDAKDFGQSAAFTWSLSGIYGWKRSEKSMFGFGVSRTYRGGELLYVPIILFNHTFNDRWGVEILMPARAHVRRNFSSKSLLLAGYELVGNSFAISTQGSQDPAWSVQQSAYLKRSEAKFRLAFEQSIKNFFWITLQGGLRYNFRFDMAGEPHGKRGEFVLANGMSNPLYFNIGLHLVSP